MGLLLPQLPPSVRRRRASSSSNARLLFSAAAAFSSAWRRAFSIFVRAEQGNAVTALEHLSGPLGSGRHGRRGRTPREEVSTWVDVAPPRRTGAYLERAEWIEAVVIAVYG